MSTESRPPNDWPPEIRHEFASLVKLGGEVSVSKLTERIDKAQSLVCHFDHGDLVAIAALKNPEQSYRCGICEQSQAPLTEADYPYEVGWIYVAPDHGGKNLSKVLLERCLADAGSSGTFATARENNLAMIKVLTRCGFRKAGTPYPSRRGDALCAVFLHASAPEVAKTLGVLR